MAPIPVALADFRCQQPHHQKPSPCKRPSGHVIGRDADSQAADVGASGDGKQDETRRVGPDSPGSRLAISCHGNIGHRRSRAGLSEGGQGDVWRNGRETGSEEPRGRAKVRLKRPGPSRGHADLRTLWLRTGHCLCRRASRPPDLSLRPAQCHAWSSPLPERRRILCGRRPNLPRWTDQD